jgi:hypothetical protein
METPGRERAKVRAGDKEWNETRWPSHVRNDSKARDVAQALMCDGRANQDAGLKPGHYFNSTREKASREAASEGGWRMQRSAKS